MDDARIAELLAPFLQSSDKEVYHSDEPRSGKEESAVLSPAQLQHISTYIDLLQRWNARVNLTAIRNEEEIVTRHFGESLFAACHLFPNEPHAGTAGCPAAERRQNAARPEQSRMGASRGSVGQEEEAAEQRKKITVADVGSGAGFPGIPIKLFAPEIALTLIEANHKKATFLREVTRTLTLTDINIQNARAEALAGESFDLVALRAVERFETVLPIAASMLGAHGRLALLIGRPQLPMAAKLLPVLEWTHPIPIPLSDSRILAIGSVSEAR